jgi:hypothetical protein
MEIVVKCLKIIIDPEDLPIILGRNWRLVRSKYQQGLIGYPKGGPKGQDEYLHRLIMNTPKGLDTDHIDGNHLDNRKSNLRVCTKAQNQHNRHRAHGLSKFKGVSWHTKTKKWQARVALNGKRIHIGVFDSEIEAAKAYDQKARELYGDFARPNFERKTL